MDIIKENNEVYILNEKNEKIAYCLFPKINENVVNILKTYVDSSLRGKGIAPLLLKATFEMIKKQDLKCIIECSYAKAWVEKNPQYEIYVK